MHMEMQMRNQKFEGAAGAAGEGVNAPGGVDPKTGEEITARDLRVVSVMSKRLGRQRVRAAVPMVGSLQRQYGFAERDLDRLGITGLRLLSCFAFDSFASHCSRFLVIARDEFVEQSLPMRLRGEFDLYRIELWCDGRLVATTRSLVLAVNWIVMKLHGRACMTRPMLDRAQG